LLATSPCFVLYSRFGTEITSLVPFLTFLGLALATRAAREPASNGCARAAAGGICLGLAVYTHALAAVLPLSAATAALCVYGRTAFANRTLRWVALGLVAGFSPRFFQMAWGSGTEQWSGRIGQIASMRSFDDLLAFPSVLGGIWNADLLYQRFAGENQIPVLPYVVVVLAVGAALWLVSLWRGEVERRESGFVLFFALLCLGSFGVASHLSLRYFLLPSLFLPQLLLVLFRPRLSMGGARAKRLAFVTVLAIAALNTFYVGRNYFVAFDRSGGRPSVFEVGNHLLETSNHFIPTGTLYRQLAESNSSSPRISSSWLSPTMTSVEIGSNSLAYPRGLRESPPGFHRRSQQLCTTTARWSSEIGAATLRAATCSIRVPRY